MRTIWKFADQQQIEMPAGARILGIAAQRDELQMWAIVDPDQPREQRTFNMYGTGHPMLDDPGEYIGSVVVMGGILVWHFFEAVTPAVGPA